MPGPVLGIHSNVTGGGKTGGHAWISLTEGGTTTTYGLWPDDHPRTVDNGAGTDIRVGMEPAVGAANRYYSLTAAQATALRAELGQTVAWGYTHNCSSWASEVVHDVVREDVNADDWGLLGIETPRQLGASILMLEARSPTTRLAPYSPPAGGGSSSSSSF